LSDSVKIQIQGPLKQIKESDNVGLDPAQMLDSVLAKKHVAMEILEQLRRPPEPQVPSIFGQASPRMAELPGSNPFRARPYSSQQPSQNGSPALSQRSVELPAAPVQDYSDKILVPNASQSQASVNSFAGSDRRQSTISQSSQSSQSSHPLHPSPAAIESLSHRLSIATNLSPQSSASTVRRTSNPGAPPPLYSSISSTSIQSTLGSPLQSTASRASITSSLAPSASRRQSAYGQSSGSLVAGAFMGTGPRSPSLSSQSEIHDPPSKVNNFHGFCKGAWAIREDPKKGLTTQVVPVGMYGRKEQWRCKQCSFFGDITMIGKVKAYDNKVNVDKDTGIQYKWMFLAKSHFKVKGNGVGGSLGYSYGCTECVDSGRRTNTYVDVRSLMEHISTIHHDGVRAAAKPEDPFWQGETISAQGNWDLFTPTYAPHEVSSPVVWTMD
jgi:hypothetical protein